MKNQNCRTAISIAVVKSNLMNVFLDDSFVFLRTETGIVNSSF